MASAGNRLNIVILDACRDNPFSRSFRSAAKGLAYMNASKGSLIAYATAPGSAASDGLGDHGLYTGKLIRNMKVPGLKIEDVFKRTRESLLKLTEGKQVSWESASIIGDFYFSSPPSEGGDLHLPPSVVQASEQYSSWMPGKVYQQEFDRQVELDHYPQQVEGRCSSSLPEYRAVFSPY